MMINNSLVNLRQQLDDAIQSGPSYDHLLLVQSLSFVLAELQGKSPVEPDEQNDLVQVIRIIEDVWSTGYKPPEQMPGSASTQAELSKLLSGIAAVQEFTLSLAEGDLSPSLKTKGLMAGSLKSLQANLRHLTWQARMIATGDLSQKVDFMGEFSDSFNTMAASLAEALNKLHQREEELSETNDRLANEIAEVRRTDEKLKEAYKDLEAFSYSVSHDLRAPLRHMSGFVALLRKTLVDNADEQTLHSAAMIATASRRMLLLVDDLLSFSRMGSDALQHEQINLNDLIKDIIREKVDEVKGREIVWSVEPMPSVYADKAMLRLAFVNLISNAVKYTNTRAQAGIEIGLREDGYEIIIRIKDNGVGFDMQYAGKLFGVFQRLHTQQEFEGTGIGLANVRRIISRHGGRTWAEGAVGQGATFYFSLPKAKES
jgi:signal transduction histidine kinase